MTYEIELAETALADIRETTRWLRDEVSPASADRWLTGLEKAIDGLSVYPNRHPLAAESEKFPSPIREILYGKHRNSRYRILYNIDGTTVFVLYIRHVARDEIVP